MQDSGIWFVELAPLTDPAFVAQTVADVLGVREALGTPLVKTLCAFLKLKHLLLILDNCEHVVAHAASLAAEILRSCPGVRILASSREPLGVPGERVYLVAPLSLPDPNHAPTAATLAPCEAVRLFAERAEATAFP
jgi:non-specific serine/threonine protein kinase